MRTLLLILLLVVAPLGLVAFLVVRSRKAAAAAVRPPAIAGTNTPAAYAAAATAAPSASAAPTPSSSSTYVPPVGSAAAAVSTQAAAAASIAAAKLAAARNQGVINDLAPSDAQTSAAEKAQAGVLQPLHSNGATAQQQGVINNAIANPVYESSSNYSYTASGEVSGIQAGLKTVPVVGSLASGAVGLLNTLGNGLGALFGGGQTNVALDAAIGSTTHGKEPSTARQVGAAGSVASLAAGGD